MDQNGKLSFAEFNQKLLKYISNSVHCDAQEKDIISRFKKLVEQRDACLAQLHKKKELELVYSEDIKGLQQQHAKAVEVLEGIEKKCNLLALEQLSIDGTQLPVKESTEQNKPQGSTDPSHQMNEMLLNRFLRKYCNLYVQFNASSSGIRVLSLADNQYYEFCLNDTTNVAELREHIWSNLAASSGHLNSWESLL
uniref:uncharacterized protein LOC120949942 n=1 Tax=Anopheles coluzzii TaxID=1518534 RepID=UPI0020FFC3EF|nr:uncharacterized protein LOC120949942 [Anopheles coluzzii]